MGTAAILLVCCALAGAAAGQSVTCTVDAAGTRGDCRPITQCPTQLQIARNARPSTEEVGQLRELVKKCQQTTPNEVQICCESEPHAKVNDCKTSSASGVVGGVNASIAEFPFLVSIQGSSSPGAPVEHICGGTLITSRHVLTAAHCVVGNAELKAVVLGELDFNSTKDCHPDTPTCADPPITVAIDEVFIHERFQNIKFARFPNDIAVLKLAKEVTFSPYIQPVCQLKNFTVLERGKTDNAIGLKGMVAGWRRRVIGTDVDFTPVLQKAFVSTQNDTVCVPSILSSEGRLCAGNEQNNADTCRGASGGPLMLFNKARSKWYQAGISSFGGDPCGNSSGYTRVLDYAEWIAEQIAKV